MNLGDKRFRYRRLFPALARLPLPLAYRMANIVGEMDARRQPEVCRALEAALGRALPAAQPGPVDQYFSMLARETLDTSLLSHIGADNIGRWVHLDGLEHLHEARREGRGVILVMAHYGRLILTMLAVALNGHALGMLTMAVDETNQELDPEERLFLGRKVGQVQRLLGGRWITLGGSLRDLYRCLEQGETITILFDAYMPSFGKRLELPFLGGRLLVAQGIERLARTTGARLVYGSAMDDGYRVVSRLRPLPEAPGEALRAAAAQLERDVKAHPWTWWQWNILELLWQP